VLTGERGHYELAAGRDAKPFLRTMEALATETRLLPEQVWSLPDLPRAHMRFGKPTGGATPLVWAHGEYLKLCRSVADGRVFDLLPEVAARYLGKRSAGVQLAEVWTFRRQPVLVAPGGTLRILAAAPFRLRWSLDEWGHTQESAATVSGVGVSFVDLALPAGQQAPVRFTFFWDESKTWEGRDFAICVGP
jgi:glucoamylase